MTSTMISLLNQKEVKATSIGEKRPLAIESTPITGPQIQERRQPLSFRDPKNPQDFLN